MPIIAAAPNAEAATGRETLDADLRVSYLPPVLPVPPVPPVSSVSPVTPMPPVSPVAPVSPLPPVPPVPPVTPVMPPSTPMVPSPPGVMSPSSPPGTDNPQVDEPSADNELLQPGRTRVRTRAYHQPTATALPADDEIFNQRPPNQPTPVLPTCDASQFSEPTTYQEAMRSPYHASPMLYGEGDCWTRGGWDVWEHLAAKGRGRGLVQVGVNVEVRRER